MEVRQGRNYSYQHPTRVMLLVTSYTCLSEKILNDTYCTKNKMTFYKYDTHSKLFLNLVLRLIPVIDISRLIRICISVITFGYLVNITSVCVYSRVIGTRVRVSCYVYT